MVTWNGNASQQDNGLNPWEMPTTVKQASARNSEWAFCGPGPIYQMSPRTEVGNRKCSTEVEAPWDKTQSRLHPEHLPLEPKRLGSLMVTAGPFSLGPACLFRATASGQTDRPRKRTLYLLGVRLPSLGSFNTVFRYCLSLDTLSPVAGLSRNWTSYNHGPQISS